MLAFVRVRRAGQSAPSLLANVPFWSLGNDWFGQSKWFGAAADLLTSNLQTGAGARVPRPAGRPLAQGFAPVCHPNEKYPKKWVLVGYFRFGQPFSYPTNGKAVWVNTQPMPIPIGAKWACRNGCTICGLLVITGLLALHQLDICSRH